MSERESNMIFEANVGKLLKASATEPSPAFQKALAEAVLAEVRSEPGRLRVRRIRWGRWAPAIAAVATAAAIALVVLLGGHGRDVALTPAAERVGELRSSFGLVFLKDGSPSRQVVGVEGIRAKEWVATHSGSQAEIVLRDQSRLFVPPRTVLQVDERPLGESVFLQEGSLRVAAAKQAAGRSLTIETPGSQIKVLGTRFDVHLVQKPDGRKQTRVSVASGRVELASSGKTVALLPNMEGIADEGRPPMARSLTAEVNEMIRLLEENNRLAEEAHVAAGSPAIIEFNGDASATVWTLLAIANEGTANLTQYVVRPATAVSEVEAYTLAGAAVPVVEKDGRRYLDLSYAPLAPGGRTSLIVKGVGAKDLFEDKGSGAFGFDRPPNAATGLSLIQFRLPASASIEEISPEPIDTREELTRRVLTVSTGSNVPRLLD